MRFQILVSLFEKIWLSVSGGYLLWKETNTRVLSRSWGRSSSLAGIRLGAIVLHCLFRQLF